MQRNTDICYLCGKPANYEDGPLDWHHAFGGARRKKSEAYGLLVRLHHNKCHLYGKKAVHNNAETAEEIHRIAQVCAMKKYNLDEDAFRGLFGKNYV